MLANLFLHYAFDAWMAREFPAVAFERYVDDAGLAAAALLATYTTRKTIADTTAIRAAITEVNDQ